jgi:hypothetical protein
VLLPLGCSLCVEKVALHSKQRPHHRSVVHHDHLEATFSATPARPVASILHNHRIRAPVAAFLPLHCAHRPPRRCWAPCVAWQPREGAVTGHAKARHRHNWPLLGRATILGRRLARTGCSPFCSASSERRRVKNACCQHIFQVFQMFYMYVPNVSYECCKSRSGCCICYNGCTRTLQVSIPNVHMFLDVCCKCVYVDIAYVLHICCKCFIWILRMFAMVFKCFCKCLRHM